MGRFCVGRIWVNFVTDRNLLSAEMSTFHAAPAAQADTIKQVQPSTEVIRTHTVVGKDTYAIKLIDVLFWRQWFKPTIYNQTNAIKSKPV